MANKIKQLMEKSTRDTPIEEIGIIILGKYTLLTKLLDPTRDIPAELTEEEKKFHASSPENTKMGYGYPSDGIFARFPKMSVKINIIVSGCIKAHATPMTVCL